MALSILRLSVPTAPQGLPVPFPCSAAGVDADIIFRQSVRMGLTLENIGQRDGRSAHITVFGSSLVELPQVYRAAADRHDLIEVDIGLLPAPRRVEDIADTERFSERRGSLFLRLVMAPEALGLLPDTIHSFVVFLRGVGLVNIPGTLHPRRPCRDTAAVTALKPNQRDIIDQFGGEARPLSETFGVFVDTIGFHRISGYSCLLRRCGNCRDSIP